MSHATGPYRAIEILIGNGNGMSSLLPPTARPRRMGSTLPAWANSGKVEWENAGLGVKSNATDSHETN